MRVLLFSKKIMFAKDEWDEAKSTLKDCYVKFRIKRKAVDRRSQIPNEIEIDEEMSTIMHTSNYCMISDSSDGNNSNIDSDDHSGNIEDQKLIIDMDETELEFRSVIKAWVKCNKNWRTVTQTMNLHALVEFMILILFTDLMNLEIGTLMINSTS